MLITALPFPAGAVCVDRRRYEFIKVLRLNNLAPVSPLFNFPNELKNETNSHHRQNGSRTCIPAEMTSLMWDELRLNEKPLNAEDLLDGAPKEI